MSEDFDLPTLQAQLAVLARHGIYVGTSSWKYEGWFDQIYTRSRYEYRGKVAASRFERDCLTEYAETFSTVCVDAAYYTFPRADLLAKQAEQVPDGFKFAFKVTDAITMQSFPRIARFGELAGTVNPEFLNADLFIERFLGPLQAIKPKVGPLIFEFSKFGGTGFARGSDFVGVLGEFLSRLPREWHYGIEIRNREWLVPEYFACLRQHEVTHVCNNWTEMPSVGEQMALPDMAQPNSVVARFLLKPGRAYEKAVKAFQPYTHTLDLNEEARKAAADIIKLGLRYNSRRDIFLYVNNRLEGNAPNTIRAVVRLVEGIIREEAKKVAPKSRPKAPPAELDLGLG